jgi:hypothetical protein
LDYKTTELAASEKFIHKNILEVTVDCFNILNEKNLSIDEENQVKLKKKN